MKAGFRVDAAAHIGNGHGFRCLAVAGALRSFGIESVFFSRSLTEDVARRVREFGFEMRRLTSAPASASRGDLAHSAWLNVTPEEDAAEVAAALRDDAGIGLILVDHYALDARWERPLRDMGLRIAVIDDLADRRHDCDVLIDTNFYEGFERRYDRLTPESTTRLLGPGFAMLRPEFADLRDMARCGETGTDRLIVSVGGADQHNVTSAICDAMLRLDPFETVDVVIGAGHPAKAELVERCGRQGFNLHVDTPDFGRLLANSTLAVGAGGTTTWERMCLGLPTLALAIAENQKRMLEDADQAGLLTFYRGDLNDARALADSLASLRQNHSLRMAFHLRGKESVDGRGLFRVAECLRDAMEDQAR